MTPQRMRTILRTRGIQGVVIAPPFNQENFSAFNFDGFACAEVQNDPHQLRFNVACPDLSYNFDLAFDELLRRGYRRPGFCSISEVSAYQNSVWESRFLWHQRELPRKDRIPLLTYSQQDESWRIKFRDWLERHQPDVLLVNNLAILNVLRKTVKRRVPGDVGVISLNQTPETELRCSGVDLQLEAIGVAAVDIVMGHLNRGESGSPPSPRSVQIKGKWVDHKTVYRKIK